jgi:hypothetical protein
MTLCEEIFEAVGGRQKTRPKDLPTTWSWEEMKHSFLTTQSHPKQRFHIMKASNKILQTRASNRFPISVSSELSSSGIGRCETQERIFKQNTVGSHFATVCFTTIHFYNPCQVRTGTPDWWCITVATQVPFLYLVRF